jgi:guanosine-3',5'-bis(diphosphate) 3'-pyrophosphohydrolase
MALYLLLEDEFDEQRIVNICWDDDPSLMTSRPVQLRVLMEDSPGTLSHFSRAIESTL